MSETYVSIKSFEETKKAPLRGLEKMLWKDLRRDLRENPFRAFC
jgi:hypothetical protein